MGKSMKMSSIFYLLLALFCIDLDGTSGKLLKKYAKDAQDFIDCPKGVPPSVCFKSMPFFPFPRVGRRLDSTFSRTQRVFGLVKQPRVGRSDPTLADNWIGEDEAYRHRVSGERDEYLKYLENYLSAQRREPNAPWAFFLITPNFQNTDQQPSLDNFIPQLDNESNESHED